jgi:hypothetical protein
MRGVRAVTRIAGRTSGGEQELSREGARTRVILRTFARTCGIAAARHESRESAEDEESDARATRNELISHTTTPRKCGNLRLHGTSRNAVKTLSRKAGAGHRDCDNVKCLMPGVASVATTSLGIASGESRRERIRQAHADCCDRLRCVGLRGPLVPS